MNWQTVIEEHYPPACRLIARMMPRHLRASHDAEDFVSEAVAVLISHQTELPYRGTQTLILIAKRKMIDAARRPHIRPMPEHHNLADGSPTCQQQAEAAELREQLLSRTASPAERGALELLAAGHTAPEIAELTDTGARTLQRFFRQFKQKHEPF